MKDKIRKLRFFEKEKIDIKVFFSLFIIGPQGLGAICNNSTDDPACIARRIRKTGKVAEIIIIVGPPPPNKPDDPPTPTDDVPSKLESLLSRMPSRRRQL